MSALADAMDGLLGAIASALTSSRVFSQPHRPAVLIQAVCARLATLCIEHVHAVARGDGTSIWDAPPAELLARVSACTRVHARFQVQPSPFP